MPPGKGFLLLAPIPIYHYNTSTMRSYVKWLPLGFAAIVITIWLLLTPPGALAKLDAVAYAVCHRIPSHSLTVEGQQFPLCARCTGMYLGALLGILYQSFWKRRSGLPGWKLGIPFVLFVVAFGLDGVNSYANLVRLSLSFYQPQNWLRLVTGTGMGLAVSAFLAPTFRQTAWSDIDRQPVLSTWAQVTGLVSLAGLADLAILSGSPVALYPAVVLSVAGVLVTLSTIYSMVWLLVLKLENRYASFYEILGPVAAGLSIAVLQIGLIDWGRFLLTHTWAGFSL